MNQSYKISEVLDILYPLGLELDASPIIISHIFWRIYLGSI